jgi:hypothetical protein
VVICNTAVILLSDLGFRKNIYITFGVLNRISFWFHFTHYLPHYPNQSCSLLSHCTNSP